MKISEISRRCGYEYCGKDIDVETIRFAEYAFADSIAIVEKKESINKINAPCILVTPSFIDTEKTIIFAGDSLEVASVKIARLLQKTKILSTMSLYRQNGHYFVGENVSVGKNTFIGPNVYIENNTVVGNDCYISANVHIGQGVVIKNGVKIGDNSTIGADSFYHYYDNGLQEFEGIGAVIIEDNVSIGSKTIIQRGTFSDTVIGHNCRIGNLIDIGHDVLIGHDCKIVSQSGVASNVKIGDYVTIYGQVGIANNVCIGDWATIYAKSLVSKNVLEKQHVSGMYARDHIEELRIQAKLRKL